MQNIKTTADLVRRDRGNEDAIQFKQIRLADSQDLMNVGAEILQNLPVLFGACAPMSAMWAALLRDQRNIPAVAVAGDLFIDGTTVFLCLENVPESTGEAEEITPWDGHCWIEIDDYIGDISIFRTARKIERPSVLRAFIEQHFGLERGLLVAKRTDLHARGMRYVGKHVLTEAQINGLIMGMGHQLRAIE